MVSGGTGCLPTCHGSMGTDGAVGIAAVHALIRMGADVNARDLSGATPLFLAAEGGRGAAVSALLAAGAEPAVRNNLGESALYIAALKGHGAALLKLLQHCEANGLPWQDPEWYGDGWTPLHAAACASHAGVATMLIAQAAAGGEAIAPLGSATAAAAAAPWQGLTLVHFSAQRMHLLRETLGNFSGSVTRNGSGRAEKWTSVSPCSLGQSCAAAAASWGATALGFQAAAAASAAVSAASASAAPAPAAPVSSIAAVPAAPAAPAAPAPTVPTASAVAAASCTGAAAAAAADPVCTQPLRRHTTSHRRTAGFRAAHPGAAGGAVVTPSLFCST